MPANTSKIQTVRVFRRIKGISCQRPAMAFWVVMPTRATRPVVCRLRKRAKHMERDVWYASARDPKNLADVREIGAYAAHRAAARLWCEKSARARVRYCLRRHWRLVCSAILPLLISGGALYRKTSFLLDAWVNGFFLPIFKLWMIHSSRRAWAVVILMTKAWRASDVNWWTAVV